MQTFTFALFIITLVTGVLSDKNVRGDITDLTSDCGSTGGEIVSVTMANCDASVDDRCQVTKGETVTGQLTFMANKATQSLKCRIFGVIGGVPIPYPGGCPVVDACSSLSTGKCPIKVGEKLVYNMEMFIDPIYPAVKIDGKWTLKDDTDSNFVCFTVPITII